MVRTVFVALCVCASPATAQMRRAVVAAGACADGLSTEPTRMVRDALGRTALGFEFLSEEETARLLGGTPSSLTEMRVLLDAARDDVFRTGDFSLRGAEEKLRKALGLIATAPPTAETWRLKLDLEVLLAYVLTRLDEGGQAGARDEAVAILQSLLAVDPEANLDPESWFLPAWHKTFLGSRTGPDNGTVRDALERMKRGTLHITSNPAGLPVAIDGHPHGKTPIKVALPAGEYVVEGLFPDRRGLPRQVSVIPDTNQSIALDPFFDGTLHQAKGPCIATSPDREERIALLTRAARALGVEQIIGVRVEEPAPGERYFIAGVVHANSGKEGNEAKVPVGESGPRPGALSQLAMFLLEGPAKVQPTLILPVRPAPESTHGTDPPAPAPMEVASAQKGSWPPKRIAGWSLVGVGAASAATSGVFFLRGNDIARRMELLCSESLCPDEAHATALAKLRQERSSQVVLSLGFGAAAVVSAVAGGYLLWAAPASDSAVTFAPSLDGVSIVGNF